VCERLHIKEGDQLILEVREGKLVLEPSINIPRTQAWFRTPKVKEKIKKAERNFKSGKQKTYVIDKFIEELDKRD
jgi:bifunctional DNA-binding transcriptional regulator/antitoxin component of YhaV-PrlF toxin-antitoxin module